MKNDPRKQFQNHRKESDLQDDREQDLWSGNYSARTMIGSWIGAALFTIVAIAIAIVTGGNHIVWWIVWILILAVWAWLIGWALYRKFSNHYWLTSQRLRHRRGILFRKMNRLELIDIDDVSYSQGPVQAIMGIGNIQIKSTDISDPNLKLVGIRDVQKVADLIDDARREERRKRGLHIESV